MREWMAKGTPASLVALGAVLAALGVGSFAGMAQAHDRQGYLYGRVSTQSGNEYTGMIRWGNQEAFWDDLFNANKVDNPHLEQLDPEDRDRSSIKVFKWRIKVDHDWSSGRVFYARFGDIARIEVTGDDEADVTMKNGSVYAVESGGDDVGGKIAVDDPSFGEIELHWDRIETIEFMSTPSSIDPPGERLYGKMYSDAGEFEGYVQWDAQECMTHDKLDGDSRDGDVSIAMGQIESLERRNRRSTTVVLKDGRELDLKGSNDVNDDNRGIFIEDERFGRVRVNWDEFDRLELLPTRGSGRGYDDYLEPWSLTGTVTDADDRSFQGDIVIDLDEAESWEILNGQLYDVEFYVPLSMVASIEPDGHTASVIEFVNGETIELDEGQDVSDSNAGVLVFDDPESSPVYIEWEEVRRIEFDMPR